MNIDYIQRAIAVVEHLALVNNDHEAAHSRQDDLMQEVLQSIADGTCKDPAACAAQALVVTKICFPRWCA